MTARKHWFKVADSVLWDGWSDGELATMIRLAAYLNTRWARDGKRAQDAGRATLDLSSARLICKRTHRADCERALRALGARMTLSVEVVGECFEINWPKFVILQGFKDPSEAECGPDPGPSETHTHTPPQDARRKTQEERTEAPSAPPAARARRVRRRSVDPRSEEAWPAIRQAFEEHGTKLGDAIGVDRSELIAKRMDEGATVDDLVAAVHGYVRANGLEPRGDFDPRRFFRPQTVFKGEGFSDRVDAGRGPRPVGSGVSKAAQLWGLR